MRFWIIFLLVFLGFFLVFVWFVSDKRVQSELNVLESETISSQTSADLAMALSLSLPLSGSYPIKNVKHSIPIEEIKQGCFKIDCIPSIDDPDFISSLQAAELLDETTIGIALSYKEVDRFYPFPMLETHELVNDTVAGDPLLISYCPLCGTGIVFERTLDGEPVEFGVSGMLWQSNLLMYNRSENIDTRNLWSQVLGQAVVGERAGEELKVVPSDIMRFQDWAKIYADGEVLDGEPKDPYAGRYYEVASNFAPNFNANQSPLAPETYVYGIKVGDVHKAYPRDLLSVGEVTDEVNGVKLSVVNNDGQVKFVAEDGSIIPDVEGFWFSWVAAHPNTLIFK